MLSEGLANTLLPVAALVIWPCTPVRRSPRTMSTVKVSLTFSVAAFGALTWPNWVSGMATSLVLPAGPIARVLAFSALLKRNWKVMSSLPSPLLSMWIS